MRLNNSIAPALLALFAGSAGVGSHDGQPAPAPPRIATAPAPQQIEQPPADLPASDGPSATSQQVPSADRYDEVGYASWYGDELRGNRTASGAIFNPDWITAAHRSLPLGAFVEVTSLDTGRTIVLEITDRGPHRADRLIDLSLGAARLLGVDHTSIAPVRVRLVEPSLPDQAALRNGQPASARIDSPAVLLAGLRDRLPGARKIVLADPAPVPLVSLKPPHAAKTAVIKPVVMQAPSPDKAYFVQVATFSSHDRATELAKRLKGRVLAGGALWRVRLGPYDDSTEADRARDGVAKRGYGDAHVVRED